MSGMIGSALVDLPQNLSHCDRLARSRRAARRIWPFRVAVVRCLMRVKKLMRDQYEKRGALFSRTIGARELLELSAKVSVSPCDPAMLEEPSGQRLLREFEVYSDVRTV
jgi:hypothetical protein